MWTEDVRVPNIKRRKCLDLFEPLNVQSVELHNITAICQNIRVNMPKRRHMWLKS